MKFNPCIDDMRGAIGNCLSLLSAIDIQLMKEDQAKEEKEANDLPKVALKIVTNALIGKWIDLVHKESGINVFLEDTQNYTDRVNASKEMENTLYAQKQIDEILCELWETPAGKEMIEETSYWQPANYRLPTVEEVEKEILSNVRSFKPKAST